MFLCQKWLADDEGDQLIERDLYESEDMRLKRRPSTQFRVFLVNLAVKKDPSLVCFRLLCIYLRFRLSSMVPR